MNMTSRLFAVALMTGCLGIAPTAASLTFDGDVTPDVIFGSGNANGGFTIDQNNGVEIGLRGKLRFDENNQPQNIFNSNGDGTYTFQRGTPPTGFSFDPNSPTTPVWNFEWSINTDFDGSSGFNLDDLTYSLSLDADPSAGTNFATFDPINLSFADHAIGDNSTSNGGGTVAGDASAYATLIAKNIVAQNSWSYEFFNDSAPLSGFDPFDVGTYDITLTASDDSGVVASSSIQVNVVPVPGAAWAGMMLVGGLGGWRLMRRRRPA